MIWIDSNDDNISEFEDFCLERVARQIVSMSEEQKCNLVSMERQKSACIINYLPVFLFKD